MREVGLGLIESNARQIEGVPLLNAPGTPLGGSP